MAAFELDPPSSDPDRVEEDEDPAIVLEDSAMLEGGEFSLVDESLVSDLAIGKIRLACSIQDLVIESHTFFILDNPSLRPHRFPFQSFSTQCIVQAPRLDRDDVNIRVGVFTALSCVCAAHKRKSCVGHKSDII